MKFFQGVKWTDIKVDDPSTSRYIVKVSILIVSYCGNSGLPDRSACKSFLSPNNV